MVETRCIASVLPAAPHALDWRRDASRLYAARRGGGCSFLVGIIILPIRGIVDDII